MATDNGIVLWYYGSEDERAIEWIKYRGIEMQIIETAYQERKSEVFLNKYRIDLKKFVQSSRDDSRQQRPVPVKRQIDCQREEYLREERFFSPPSLTSAPSYGSAQAWCPFLSTWLNSPAGKKALFDFSSAIDACADGILRETAKHCSDSEAKANWMVEQLRACKTKSRRETANVCVHLDTRESFLYRILNTALREGDHSKIDTMGPLCFLIRNYSRTCKGFIGIVYRGVDLSPTTIAKYRQAVGMWRTWPSFTSTSKNRKMAELQGNTLFIITITAAMFSSAVRAYDIEEISQVPSEEEVLLPAGISFHVVNVEQDSCKKTIIEIKI